jgi:hypothetical protein
MKDRPEYQALLTAEGELKPFGHHMLALGRLCITWAFLDRQLNDALTELLGCSAAQAACIANEATDVAERCRILKTLCYVDGPGGEWRETFERLLNRIENELAPLRNRYVHDYWKLTDEALERMDRRARLGKPQSFQEKQITFDTTHVTPHNEVGDFSVKVAIAMSGLHFALLDLTNWRAGSFPERPRLLAWAQAEKLPKLHQLDQPDAEPPPRSSPA